MTIYDFSVKPLRGDQLSMAHFRNKVLLIVNTASECGFTGQYEELEKLHKEFADQGLAILGFPCNQFGQQEPGDSATIEQFCTTKFGVQFPMFQKIEVNGETAHPLYQFLKEQAPGLLFTKNIKWNFTKFLVSKTGNVIDRFGSVDTPESLEKVIEKAL